MSVFTNERSSGSNDSLDDVEMQEVRGEKDDYGHQKMRLLSNKRNSVSPHRSLGSSETLDDVEMQGRDDDYGDQDGLLSSGNRKGKRTLEPEFETKWHLRTPWVVFLSFSTAIATILTMWKIASYITSKGNTVIDYPNPTSSGFRRSASDYELNPNWDFDASPKVRTYHWTIKDIEANPDGVFRPMITINSQFPGPMIECNEGDVIIIDVDNQAVNATSIHFHGIFQNGTNHMDGTTGITQCPIAPGNKFRYQFNVTGQSGTYYYHGHQAVQVSDGLYGPLIIHSKKEKTLQPISYSTDRVIMLQDYYHELSSGLTMKNLEPDSEASPIPDGALINGLNSVDCSVLPHRTCNNSTAILPSFHLAANENHRLRFINTGAFAWFQVGLDEHEFAITEVDGTDIMPSYDTRMMISPAQRYSMIVNTNRNSTDAFWLRARMVTHCWKEPSLPANGADEVRAVIRYISDKDTPQTMTSKPTSQEWKKPIETWCKDMNTTSFIPTSFEPAPQIADHSYFIRVNLERHYWRLQRGYLNSSTFRPQVHQPTLHRTIDGFSTKNESFTSMAQTNGVNSISYNQENDYLIQHSGVKVVDIIIRNFDEGNHPMHLHGHKVWVLGQGHGDFPGYQALHLQPEGRGTLPGHEHALDNLIRRDVATVEGFGWLALRFVADNPGIWAFHCHMMWHGEAGMAMQFMDRVDEVMKMQIPEENQKLCQVNVEELEKGSIPKDEIWFGFGPEDE
ncbi:hypothetical protein BTUL_0017g00160 [Botrytis tulipae]|uniref:Multicopper oxidase n=1 Tax=Botrytis tulipae TaxID=87230 RepID=A0A4Z1EZ41_9HELO|nr:hypothetical protein BTUL_0017g00160 [Botrytis tulipae]